MTQNSCCELLNHFIEDIQKIDYLRLLTQAQDKYGVKEFKISQITPVNAFQIYNSIYTKAKKNNIAKTELNWWENQLRIFIWILVCYLELRTLKIQELGFFDWQFFSRLFPNKQQILFEYQALSFLKENINTKKWVTQQDQIFTKLVEHRDSKYKWSELAKELYISSNKKYFRTPKQCRERWLNHLDPNKSKQEWDLKEDYVLITHVKNKGKKWAEISKLLKNKRNQHSIKNRYKSLITKEEKNHEESLYQQVLLQSILKRYQNHFSRLRQTNPIVSQSYIDYQQKKYNLPATTEDFQPIQNRRAFQIHASYPMPFPRSTSMIRAQHIQPSFHSFPSASQYGISSFSVPHFSMNLLTQKEQRQKQIRADMFLSSDPFDFLRRFFKCRDDYE